MDIDVVDVETREQILAANKAQLLKWLTKLQMVEHAFNRKMVRSSMSRP
jgi:succinate dehydrogenase flavin-adding protein (antitoxin of CptAB toxin-antitoxin module)